jgi:hypothetical protein
MAIRVAIWLATVAAMSGAASAMDVKLTGDQIILSGPVVGNEYRQVADLLATNPGVTTVILRNSPGGAIPTGYRLGELFRAKGIHTAVSGYCISSCSRMFLGGRNRSFTDDVPAEFTYLGFHGHYGRDGRLRADLVDHFGLKSWIIKHSDGNADDTLVERWVHIPWARGTIHFFPPDILKQHDYSTYMCQGDEAAPGGVFACEPIAKSAMDLGIVTSLAPLHSNDRKP